MKNIIINQVKTIFNFLKTSPDNIRFDDNWSLSTREKSVRVNTNIFKYKASNGDNLASPQNYQNTQLVDSVRIFINIQNNQAMPDLSFQPTMGHGHAGMMYGWVPDTQCIVIEYSDNSSWVLNGVTYNCDAAEAIEKIYIEMDKLLDQFLDPVTYHFYWNDGRRTSTNKTGTIAEIMEAEGYPNWKKELTCYAVATRDRNLVWDAVNKAWQF